MVNLFRVCYFGLKRVSVMVMVFWFENGFGRETGYGVNGLGKRVGSNLGYRVRVRM